MHTSSRFAQWANKKKLLDIEDIVRKCYLKGQNYKTAIFSHYYEPTTVSLGLFVLLRNKEMLKSGDEVEGGNLCFDKWFYSPSKAAKS